MKTWTTILSISALAVGLYLCVGLAPDTVSAQEERDLSVQSPIPLLDNYELMDYMIDPVYERLKDAVAVKPEGRKGWRALYVEAFSMAELSNLVYLRDDEDYMGTDEWNEMTTISRKQSMDIVTAIKAKDYPSIRKHYESLIQTCNKCHEQFVPDDPTEVKPW